MSKTLEELKNYADSYMRERVLEEAPQICSEIREEMKETLDSAVETTENERNLVIAMMWFKIVSAFHNPMNRPSLKEIQEWV